MLRRYGYCPAIWVDQDISLMRGLLQGFQRVSLAPGESRKLDFTLDETNVRYWNSVERGWVIDPGMFDIWLGNSSKADQHATFKVGGKPRPSK